MFGGRIDTISEKKMAAILSKFNVLYLSSYFVIYFLKLKLIMFYNRVVYYYTRIFLVLLPQPAGERKRELGSPWPCGNQTGLVVSDFELY